jgi:hypothetical protein
VINKFILILFIFVLFFYCYEFIDFILNPEKYRFGSEVDGWRYFSELHYTGSLIVEVLLLLLGVLAGFFIKKQNQILVGRITIVFIIIVSNIV